MKHLNSLKFWYNLVLMLAILSFTACVDDNDDTEAPFLEVAPTTLTFTEAGAPADGSQSFFEIKTNRSWTATIQEGADWVTLSKKAGEGSAKVEVSIPGGVAAEAKIDVVVSNKTGQLFKETVKVIRTSSDGPVEVKTIYNETFGKAEKVNDRWPFIDQFSAWVTSGEGATEVSYTGEGASVRQSGKLSEAYENASGEAKLFFGANSNFVINKIALAGGQVNLKLTFGASYSKNNNGTYDNEFKSEKFHFYLSADGKKWTDAVSYDTQKAGDFWVFATSNFTLKNAVAHLYIKYAADEASVFAIDDVTLTTGVGGAEVDLNVGGSTPDPQPQEAKEITFAEIQAKLATPGVIDADNDRYFIAVVQNNMETGTRTYNQLQLAALNASQAGEGITLFGDVAEKAAKNLAQGDKVKVILVKGLAETKVYSGLNQITGKQGETWAKIEKLNETVKIQPVVITADQLAAYQAMTVIIKNASPKEAGMWCTSTQFKSNAFVADGKDFVVFCGNKSVFANQSYKVATGDVIGLAAVYKNNAQLVPRSLEDVKVFATEGGDQGGGDQGGDLPAGEFENIPAFLFTNGKNEGNVYDAEMKVNGAANGVSSFRIGKSKGAGVFTSGKLGVTGDKKLTFYAAAWSSDSKTKVYFRVNGGGSIKGETVITPKANSGMVDNSPYTVTFTASDKYTLDLTGLTEESTITISTDVNFSSKANVANGNRAAFCGFQLN